MKKTFYQTNLFFQIFALMIFAYFVAVQVIVFIGLSHVISLPHLSLPSLAERIVALWIMEAGAFLTFWVFLRLEHNNIHIKGDKIYMNDDWSRRSEKIQFYSEVLIPEIRSIDIIYTRDNCLLKPIQTMQFSVPKAYISFQKSNGETVNMLILHMSRKTVSKMIDYIKEEMKRCGNFSRIEDTAVLVEKFIFRQEMQKAGGGDETHGVDTLPLRNADKMKKERILLSANVQDYCVIYRRIRSVNELVVNGKVYDEMKAVFELPHNLLAVIDGHTIEAGYSNGAYSYIRFDGRTIAKKRRWI